MRFLAIFPLLCATAALILSFLCLFAGDKKSFLQNADILTLNTSEIGYSSIFNSSDSSSSSWLSSIESSIESEIDSLLKNATEDIAKVIGVHDFYSVHVMDYCEGYYKPNATAKDASKNTTKCSNSTALFHFDPEEILNSELNSSITLSDLGWPDALTDGIKTLRVAFKVMFVFYIIGIVFTGLAFIGALAGFFLSGRLSACGNWLLSLLAFITLGVASGISTAIAVKATHEVNKYGKDINISAKYGKTFMGMTWAATAVMLLASFAWIAECCAGRRKTRTYNTKSEI